ncbi:MAG: class I SAM-dependent DNA methyltransferase [Promethearchaeota archaeon]
MSERPSERYYRDTARFYEPFATRPDEPFYREMAKRYGSPILELACGTGRISLMLAEKGHEIVGVELSPEMREIAQEKLQKLSEDVRSRVTFHKGDITDFNLDQTFPLIIIPSSFKFLLTIDDQIACLRCVRSHLQDDGVFILDLYPGEAFEEDGAFTTAPIEIDGAMVTKSYRYSNDLNTQLRHWDVVVEVKKPDGTVERIETQSITSLFFPREIDLLLELAGFQVLEEYGNWDFSSYNTNTFRRILVLRALAE